MCGALLGGWQVGKKGVLVGYGCFTGMFKGCEVGVG